MPFASGLDLDHPEQRFQDHPSGVANLDTHTVDLAPAIWGGALRTAEPSKRLVCGPYGLQKDTANADLVGLSKPEFHASNRRI
jgi:hypothetical protein